MIIEVEGTKLLTSTVCQPDSPRNTTLGMIIHPPIHIQQSLTLVKRWEPAFSIAASCVSHPKECINTEKQGKEKHVCLLI